MGLFRKYVNQTRKPEGKLGRMMLNGMNSGHAKLADWGMSHLGGITPPSMIAELGCGGGRNAGELLKRFPAAKGTAIDYSPLAVETAIKYNNALVDGGRLEVKQGDVSALALPDNTYDLATAFETVYFWPGLEKCFSQVCRILKPGGYFMIVNESDGTDSTGAKFEKIIDGMKVYTESQLRTALLGAGFSIVNTTHHKYKPWLTIIAQKE